ncbi:MAG: hypothetical protein J7M21_02595, partial [Planctomycetes bacterium]|nr:hypothetical protein [Planctomycetota bacterium]
MPDRQRETIACRYLRQMSVRQTARVMGCAEGTIKAAALAGLKNLRKALAAADNTRLVERRSGMAGGRGCATRPAAQPAWPLPRVGAVPGRPWSRPCRPLRRAGGPAA